MCGRYALAVDQIELMDYFGLAIAYEVEPHWNITPGRRIAVIRQTADGERECARLKWGLVPFWAKDEKIGYKLSNARGETAAQKPSFRNAFKHRRCLVPASGFYEWDPNTKPKQPYYISAQAGTPLAMAGLWESWRDPTTGDTVESCCIITTASNALMQDTVHHDRMPVLLDSIDWDSWLARENARAAELQPLIAPYSVAEMQAWKVSTRVNRPGDDEASLIDPLT